MKKLLLIPAFLILLACGVAENVDSATSITPPIGGYEEGTWTPAVGFSASCGETYNVLQNGSYIKIGRFVRASAIFRLSGIGTCAGADLYSVRGLPFPSSNTSLGTLTACPVIWDLVSVAKVTIVGRVPNASSVVTFLSAGAAATSLSTAALFAATTTFEFTCSYYTD